MIVFMEPLNHLLSALDKSAVDQSHETPDAPL